MKLASVFCIIYLFCISSGPQTTNIELKDRFRHEAPASWKLLVHETQTLSFKCQKQFSSASRNVVQSEAIVHINRNNKKLHERFTSEGIQDIVCANSSYGFKLRRHGSESWRLLGVISRNETDFDKQIRAIRIDELSLPWLRIDQITLTELVDKESFDLKGIDWNLTNPSLVDIFFEWPGEASGPNYSGRLTLDPNSYWCIKEFDLSQGYKEVGKPDWPTASLKGQVEYDSATNGIPNPKSATYTLESPIEKVLETRVYDYSDFSVVGLPTSSFLVSEYGFVEPTHLTNSPFPVAWRSLGIIAALLFLGLLFFKLARD